MYKGVSKIFKQCGPQQEQYLVSFLFGNYKINMFSTRKQSIGFRATVDGWNVWYL